MEVVGKSDIGLVRKQNQDSIYYGRNESGEILAIVCDGIGGGNAGDIASSIGVSVLKAAFENKHTNDHKLWIKESVDCANEAILKEAKNADEYEGMGTTLVGVLVTNELTYLFHLGDSRVYMLKNDKLSLLTQDHNLASDLLKAGEINEEEASNHPKGALLTNALGIWEHANVEINCIKNDYQLLLICSDGLHGYVAKDDIYHVLMSSDDLTTKVDKLINQSKLAGGFDNISIILIAGGDLDD